MQTASTGISLIIMLAGLVVMVLWICMPFAIFGTKPLLRELLAEQQKTNRLLEEAAERAKPAQTSLVSERYQALNEDVHRIAAGS